MENEERQEILLDGLQTPDGFKLFSDGLYSDPGKELVSVFPFFVDARVHQQERGEYFYRVVVQTDSENVTRYISTEKGPRGIVHAVNRTGAFIRYGLALDYVDKFLALNFRNLPILDSEDCQEEIFGVEAGSIYELFLEYLAEHEEDLREMKLGKYLEGGAMVAVKLTVMQSFFKQASVVNIQNVLRYWKQNNLLVADSDEKHLSRAIRINHALQRVYVVKVIRDNEDESSQAQGIQVGDTVSLAVAGSDEILTLTLINGFVSGTESNYISTQSKLGTALIGKDAGDSVTVRSGSSITLYRILEIQHAVPATKKQYAGAI